MITSAITARATWIPSLRYICDVLGYKVFVSDGLTEEKVYTRVGGSTFFALIDGLQPDYNYAVQWAPYTYYGDLPRNMTPENYDTPRADSKIKNCVMIFWKNHQIH